MGIMSEQAEWQGDDTQAQGLTARIEAGLASAAGGRPRIDASSFRLLTERLKRPAPQPTLPVIPDLMVAPAPVPEAAAPLVAVPDAAAPPVAVPEALAPPEPEFLPDAEPVDLSSPAPEPVSPWRLETASEFSQPVLHAPPAILPPPEEQSLAVPAAPAMPADASAGHVIYGPVHPDMAMDLGYVPPPVLSEPRAAEPRPPRGESRLRRKPESETQNEAPAAPEKPEPRRRSADSNVQLLKQIKMLVFSPPSLADRTAYLKEAAEIMAAEEAQQRAEAAPEELAPELSLDHIQPASEAGETAAAIETAAVEPALGEPLPDDEPGPAAAVSAPDLPAIPPELALPQEVSEPLSETPAAPVAATAVPPAAPTVMNEAEAMDLARSLLDMMSASAGNALPQERLLAADTLLRLVPRLPLKPRVMLADRIGIMEQPPHLLVSKLIRDTAIEVAGPLLENASQLTDQDLAQVIEENHQGKLRMIARRRHVSRAVGDQLIATRDASVQLTLIRNAGAEISHNGFLVLAAECEFKPDLLAPLCTRPDLPAPTAFDLFWLAPPQLRRYLISRFLTDSETLARILKITLASQGSDEPAEDRTSILQTVQAVVADISAGRYEAGAERLAEVARINQATALRVIGDPQGEPLAVLLKAIAFPRNEVTELLHQLQRGDHATLQRGRDVSELQALFESLSFNKARMLLTYWDWAVLKTGPYAPVN